ncbi:MAG TPA: cytochrome C biogenesis protein [Rhodospirillaceae bacterium]|nr:MAG: cytochrome C biogenesis protein [Alphaproteobacteria bacterium GWF2_58_20]HAU28631.1 cytochrome C biogenesis protein [Rhodospirillaceae bacterium]
MLFLLAITSAFWLGLLTSISPCPLATNIAAISYVGAHSRKDRQVLWAGIAYTFGRSLTYALLGMILLSLANAIPAISCGLQKYMNILLGPLLILVGMVLLNILSFHLKSCPSLTGWQRHVKRGSIWGAGLLGIFFALSFCPTSAALFFGSLLPLAIQHHSQVILPATYGIATGLPVLVFALLLATGRDKVAGLFGKLSVFEAWARRATGIIFIVVGIYYSLIYVFAWQPG